MSSPATAARRASSPTLRMRSWPATAVPRPATSLSMTRCSRKPASPISTPTRSTPKASSSATSSWT